jgi:acetoin utilization deacetylase AcuC-like enzyme
MTTAYLTDPRTHAHSLPEHPEHAERLQAVESRFNEAGLPDRLFCLTPEPAAEEHLLAVHTPAHLQMLADAEKRQYALIYGGDTYIVPASYQAARLSAGAAIRAVDVVLKGEADNALVAMRPPGHHALPNRPMGFCLLANAAIAVHYARETYGVERILIVDYDVNHGNGTQDIFYEDPNVLFVSTHQHPFYPGSGRVNETGEGQGRGTTVNIPLPAGYGDAALARVYEQVLWPIAIRFAPEIIFVSAGFDCHWDDPLAGMTLTLTGYAHLTRELVRMADTFCGGQIIFLLEGGYSLPAVSYGMLNIAYALLGEAQIVDPLPLPDSLKQYQDRLPPLNGLLTQIREIHALQSDMRIV